LPERIYKTTVFQDFSGVHLVDKKQTTFPQQASVQHAISKPEHFLFFHLLGCPKYVVVKKK
jgi:hypothetical protein